MNCLLSGAIVRIGGAQKRADGVAGAKYSAITDIGIRCIKNAICILDQASLIHIYSGVKSNLKRTAVRIYKSSHASSHLSL